mmetsp:Transcript_24160/g.71692  ORF Transcript_24160/g.71692 Transcript_24160/m.71692 type:complete len:336 (-) Transcript_24160:192-1199(-)
MVGAVRPANALAVVAAWPKQAVRHSAGVAAVRDAAHKDLGPQCALLLRRLHIANCVPRNVPQRVPVLLQLHVRAVDPAQLDVPPGRRVVHIALMPNLTTTGGGVGSTSSWSRRAGGAGRPRRCVVCGDLKQGVVGVDAADHRQQEELRGKRAVGEAGKRIPLGGHQHGLLAALAAPQHAEVAHARVHRHVDCAHASAVAATVLGQPQPGGVAVSPEPCNGRGSGTAGGKRMPGRADDEVAGELVWRRARRRVWRPTAITAASVCICLGRHLHKCRVGKLDPPDVPEEPAHKVHEQVQQRVAVNVRVGAAAELHVKVKVTRPVLTDDFVPVASKQR